MKEDSRWNVYSSLSDLESFDGCGTELTRTNSDSSAITVDISKASTHQCAASFPINQSTKWTDHQHCLYLNSLEASFVNELHQSIQLRGWRSQNDLKYPLQSKTSQNSQNMTKQFPVLRDACWKRICLQRNELVLQSTADSHVLAGSPLRLAPIARGCTMRESDVYDCGMLCNKGIHVRGISKFSRWSPRVIEKSCHQESADCTAEVTAQNFKNGDQGASSSLMPRTKRLKTATANASSNDQVVPSGNFHRTDISSNIDPSSESVRRHELLSKFPERFHHPKSDLHNSLRGS